MTRWFGGIFLISAMLVSAPKGQAQNVSVQDYRVPVSRAASLSANLNYGYEQDDETMTHNDGAFDLTYNLFYESLPFAYSLDFLGNWSQTWANETFGRTFRTDGTARVKKYVSDSYDLFGSVEIHGLYQRRDDWPASDLTLGVGWGRFINATALRKAVRVDEFFVEEGVTSARLPKETMLEIATLFEREKEYRQIYGEDAYRTYWFSDVEDAVRESGLLKGETLGAAGILRMEEVLTRENIGDRFYGWDATLGAKFDLTLADPDLLERKPRADMTLRYARPIGWDTQIDARIEADTPFDPDEFGKAYQMASTLGYLYELTNRVDFRTNYQIALTKMVGSTSDSPQISHTITPSFLFYVENEFRLVAAFRFIKAAQDPWANELSLTLNYKAF